MNTIEALQEFKKAIKRRLDNYNLAPGEDFSQGVIESMVEEAYIETLEKLIVPTKGE